MRIIESELKEMGLFEDIAPENLSLVKRAIHASADFDYAKNLIFSHDPVAAGLKSLSLKTPIITDTKMIVSGISKTALNFLETSAQSFVSDPGVVALAKSSGNTRSKLAMQKALAEFPEAIYVIGNAPTALIEIHDWIKVGKARPSLVIGCPVGFVNVIESKELILEAGVPSIVAKGRKGGSTIAVSLINALLYKLYQRK